ncbi:MAG: (Dimethylallyl)adenosine tRNA methylthiotransferase MiaB [Bacteroidetes bacterium ADurb.Bin408]|nr:MAG: (Dimethylallyl)adenosine tRNA methylthiotransferase MiaB [Bacteroidetes bacterium ADurb.Bin408]
MQTKKIYIETYGCQMNFSDSEIVAAVVKEAGHSLCESPKLADVIFVNTCSIRENAELRVRNRIQEFKSLKKKNPDLIIGILGCMAERLKTQLLEEEQFVDIIAGPDAYRDIPHLIGNVESGIKGVNVLLSHEETYSDLNPVRLGSNGVSAFISIMRGCQNFCTYCVVPYTRGKERSRDMLSIVNEATSLFNNGYREITLLGQNVNSYNWQQYTFADLIKAVAQINPLLRVRFATSHPKDMSDALIHTIAALPNICKSVHLPVQSGSTAILNRMHRKYTREAYLERIQTIRKHIPEASITTDIITGFCGETEEDHQTTLSLMETVSFDYAFMFKYSQRPGTQAAKLYADDIPEEVKAKRLQEIIDLQNKLSLKSNRNDIGKIFEVLAEGPSKRSQDYFSGRNSQNKMVIFPARNTKPGDYVNVKVTHCTSASLKGEQCEV